MIERLRAQPEIRTRLLSLSDAELEELLYDWQSWARPNQLAPQWDWALWLILAGRGYGKTRVGAEQCRRWNREGRRYVNLIAATKYDLRHVMVDGESGVLAVCPKHERPQYKSSTSELIWPNGAVSLLFSAEEPDRLRGPQADGLWCDEVASWQYDQDAWDMAMFGLRLGTNPQVVATTTPKPTKLIRALIADPTTAVTRGTTYENKSNLAPTFYTKIIKKYEGTRLGRQEINAEVLDDNPGAMFKMSDIEGARVAKLPPLTRIVVALDPATTSTEESDEWGIIAAAQDGRDPAHFYVLADETAIYTPDEAAKQAVRLYHRLGADRIVGEANNGGDMIETILRYQDSNIAYKKVTASRGKAIRAEPVSALYEQHRVHHHGTFGSLEAELTQWNPATDDRSPNRLDATVWAMTELAGGTDGWAGYVKAEAKEMQAKGVIAPEPGPRVDVMGVSRDICACGSRFWVRIGDKESCLKCQQPRPA